MDFKLCFYCKTELKFDSNYLKHMNSCKKKFSKMKNSVLEHKAKKDDDDGGVVEEEKIYCMYCDSNDKSFCDLNSYLAHFESEHNQANQSTVRDSCSLVECHLCLNIYQNGDEFYEHMKIHSKELFDLHGINYQVDSSNKLDYIEKLIQILTNPIYLKKNEDQNYSEKILIDCCLDRINDVLQQQQHENLSQVAQKAQDEVENFIDFDEQLTCLRSFLDEENKLVKEDKMLLTTSSLKQNSFVLSVTNKKDSQRKSYDCKICFKKFQKSNDLLRHLRVHNNERPFKCNICLKSFKLKCVLETHMKIHLQINKQSYVCTTCDSKFSSKGSLELHSRIHTGYKPFKCKLCLNEVRFRTSSQYKSHLASKHLNKFYKNFNTENKNNQNKFQLDDNEFFNDNDVGLNNLFETFNDNDFLKSHDFLFDLRLPEQHDSCKNEIKTTEVTNKRKRKSKKIKYADNEMSVCGEKTNKEFDIGLLNNLLKTKCDSCDHLFLNQNDYLKHILRKHNNEDKRKKYECESCKKTFLKPSQLKRHSLIHTGEKPFKCTICSKAFNQKNTLTLHMRTHDGARPYKCSFCEATFTQNGNLQVHIKRVHEKLNSNDCTSDKIDSIGQLFVF